MITVYGSLITVFLCTFLPPFLDYSRGKKDDLSWKRAVAAYGVMTGGALVLPVFIPGTVHVMLVFTMIAVAVAVFIAPVSLLGTSFVLLMSTVINPTMILWDIARYQKIKEPMRFVLSTIEWPRFLVPMALGLVTYFVGQGLHQRYRRKERPPTAA